MRDDFRLRQLRRDLRECLPRDKSDVDAVPKLVALGYPAVEPILLDLLKWIRQCEWPVSQPIADFLAQIGTPLTPYLEHVFRSHDESWAARVITGILECWPATAIAPLIPYISQQAIHAQWGRDLEAMRLLARHRLVDFAWASALLASKQRFHEEQLADIQSILAILEDNAV